jgi:hypothetical protein
MLDGATHTRQSFAPGHYLRHPVRSLRASPQYRLSPIPCRVDPDEMSGCVDQKKDLLLHPVETPTAGKMHE